MPSIEEAFAALGRYEQAGCRHVMGTCPQGIARALAEAVLEEALNPLHKQSGRGGCDACRVKERLRARIEKLGKEGT